MAGLTDELRREMALLPGFGYDRTKARVIELCDQHDEVHRTAAIFAERHRTQAEEAPPCAHQWLLLPLTSDVDGYYRPWPAAWCPECGETREAP